MSNIKPYPKTIGRVKTQSVKTLRNKADRLYQELGSLAYDRCLVCGGEYSCLHHYYPKSTSTALRYDLENGINICAGCHTKHHLSGNPEIQNTINKIKGKKWLDELTWRKRNVTVDPNVGWYKIQIEILQTMIDAYKSSREI